MKLIITTKGFVRGSGEYRGHWIHKEDLIKIWEENPKWLRVSKFRKTFGL